MNILLAPSSYAPNIGGVEEMTRGLAREMHARGHGVAIVAARWPASLPEKDQIDGLPVLRLNYPLPARDVPNLVQFARRFKATAMRLRSEALTNNSDIIHIHCLGPNALYATWVARKLGKPLILTTHGELQGDDTGWQRSIFSRWVHRYVFRNVRYITACSKFTLEQIPYESAASRTVIYNAIALQAAGAPQITGGRPYMFCAARLTFNKGMDVAVRAFAAASGHCADLELWIAGDGKERVALEHLCESLGVANRVRFLGSLSPEHIASLMQASVFCVCPSRNEGFGLVNLEAMAAGKAVIASRVGGVPEIVLDGETGILVSAEDVCELSGAIVRLAADKRLRERLGAAGRARARQFTWDRIGARYEQIYAQVLTSAA